MAKIGMIGIGPIREMLIEQGFKNYDHSCIYDKWVGHTYLKAIIEDDEIHIIEQKGTRFNKKNIDGVKKYLSEVK